IEALGMDGVGTSIIEGLDPCLQPHHPPFTGMSRIRGNPKPWDLSHLHGGRWASLVVVPRIPLQPDPRTPFLEVIHNLLGGSPDDVHRS
ncbi:MAG: hypothetical protein E7K80_11460, partial [Cutibacterium avidum]|nr:hypothetical protein [Cutibacterium avidum]